MDEADEEPLPLLEPADLAPGWEEEGSVLCIGGQTPLDEAAAAMLAGLLNKHGLKARVAESETVSAGNIVSLEAAKAKLVCLSFLGIGSTLLRYAISCGGSGASFPQAPSLSAVGPTMRQAHLSSL